MDAKVGKMIGQLIGQLSLTCTNQKNLAKVKELANPQAVTA